MNTASASHSIAVLLMLVLLPTSGVSQSNPLDGEVVCGTGLIQESQLQLRVLGGMTTTSVLQRGGMLKTASGYIRVLVVFVRFVDDVTNTTYWPDYTVLPGWASTIVDDDLPAGNAYSSLNLSNFFDRASGGDGMGNLGNLQILGDIYYVTTDNARTSYYNDAAVNSHVWEKLDNQGVDFSLYDNWTFRVGGMEFAHQNSPDGEVDYIFMMWRTESFSGPSIGGYMPQAGYYLTNDGVVINSNSGSSQFRSRDIMGPYLVRPKTIFYPAHEFSHYLFAGGNVRGHIDGRDVYGTTPNVGNVMFFGLMTSNASGNFCAFERYRAGWLNPQVIIANQGSITLKDTHVENDAILIPIRHDASGNIVEHFLVEKYHTTNDYSGANPFLSTQIFNHTLRSGILVYHIENEDLWEAMNSNVDIESADGLWTWNLAAGESTPTDRTDDIIGHSAPSYSSGYDERDRMTMTVGSTLWTDYYALYWGDNGCGSGNPCPGSCDAIKCNHGWRYFKSSWLGDNEDFFRLVENDVFSRYSNPSTELSGGGPSECGFEILSYNSTTKAFSLSVAVNNSGILALKPSKPMGLSASKQPSQVADLSWIANGESDVTSGGGYNVFRAVYHSGNPEPTYAKINSAIVTSTSFVDNSWVGVDLPAGTNPVFRYRITAEDATQKESVKSDSVEVSYTYQEYLLGLASQKRTTYYGATKYNGEHLLEHDASGRLHYVFQSGGEVFYRRSTDEGVSWGNVSRLSIGDGSNAWPSITVAHNGTLIVVWVRTTSTYNYNILSAYSTDAGFTWTSPQLISTSYVSLTDGPTPVVAAMNGSQAKLLCVWAKSSGLAYRSSSSLTSWTGSVGTVPGSAYYSEHPSLASFGTASTSANLVYNRSSSIYANRFDANSNSWSGVATAASGSYARYASIGLDPYDLCYDVFSRFNGSEWVIRQGWGIASSNWWETGWYDEFTVQNLDSFWPSITYYINPDYSSDCYSIVWSAYRSSTWKVMQADYNPYYYYDWIIYEMSGNGHGGHITHETGIGGAKYPTMTWADFTNTPYLLRTYHPSTGLQKSSGASTPLAFRTSRSVEIRDIDASATVVLKFEGLKFMRYGPRERASVDRSRIFDYLQTEDFRPVAGSEIDLSISSSLTIQDSLENEVNVDRLSDIYGDIGISLDVVAGGEVIGQIPVASALPANDGKMNKKISLDEFADSQIRLVPRVVFKGEVDSRETEVAVVNQIEIGGSSDLISVEPERVHVAEDLSIFPNPFNPSTHIVYSLLKTTYVRLRIYDMIGREMAILVDGEKSRGTHDAFFDASGLPSGLYFCRLEMGDKSTVKKLILVR